MRAMMMECPLKIADILTYAAEVHPAGEVITAAPGGPERMDYKTLGARIARLAAALLARGVRPGDRVATLAFNNRRHFELYYAISGIGAVCHTLNPRLSPTDLAYIVEDAGDCLLFHDPHLAPLAAALPMPPGTTIAMDEMGLDSLVDAAEPLAAWPDFAETDAAGLCYTSGTTGAPKGALYSHRSTVLHALSLAVSLPKVFQERRRILPVVPLFHVNAWGLPYAAPLAGASLVMPGPDLSGPALFDLMDQTGVYSAWGVPTVWFGLLDEIAARGRCPTGFGDVVIGGSAAPPAMIARFEALGVNVCHAWGMTEMSPVGTVCHTPPQDDGAPEAARLHRKARQGRRLFGVELKIVDEAGENLPHNGRAAGELRARGNTVISAYHGRAATTDGSFDEGWFTTGDVASIDADGFLAIEDRTKDMIKSGGEWISSIALENAAAGAPGVATCAAIAIPDARWGERPLLVVVPADGFDEPGLRAHLLGALAKWQVPERIVCVDALPLTATGKVSKRTLRDKHAAGEL
ncbi:MAG: long-chain-fatty-acid--CoA ligase [Pseudomonadota bacterium]